METEKGPEKDVVGCGGCAAAAGWLGRRRRRYEARARGPGREEEEDVARGGEMAAENKPEERFPKCILRS